MSTRHLFSLIVAVACLSSVGCCGYWRGCGSGYGGQMFCGPGCGCPSCGCEDTCCEPACGCCEPACGCCDVCTGPSCGCCDACCEPACGCMDCCSEPSCGCDVGCGTPVGYCPILGNCCIIRRLRQAFWGAGWCGGYAGCSPEPYWSEWHNDPPCNCHGGGMASTGGRYGYNSYGHRAQLTKQNISEELRFADQGSGTTYK